MKYGHEIAKKVILGLSPQKDNPLQAVSNKIPAFTKSNKMAVPMLDLSIFEQPILYILLVNSIYIV